VIEVSLRNAQHPTTLQAALAAVPRPAVILVPHWGADGRFPGGEAVHLLNALTKDWRVLATFGENDVLINAAYPNPSGNPAFSVAVID
jgi:hypothetical protein